MKLNDFLKDPLDEYNIGIESIICSINSTLPNTIRFKLFSLTDLGCYYDVQKEYPRLFLCIDSFISPIELSKIVNQILLDIGCCDSPDFKNIFSCKFLYINSKYSIFYGISKNTNIYKCIYSK